MVEKAKNTGLVLKEPAARCNDKKCPFHGDLKVRGRIFVGKVVSALAKNTATVSWERRHYITKYERYERRRTKVHAHNPECIGAKKDDLVRIAECRPLSKTKHFVIVEKLGKVEKVEGIEEKPEETAKQKEKKEKKDDKKEQKVAKERKGK
nr:30S ribosomal protein S17P [uncultured archaeon]